MNKLFRILYLPLVAMLVGLNSVEAKEAAHNISEWTFGNTAFGDPVDIADTKGKVVVYEYWGVNCPPCIASLPHLAKLDKKYRDDGLIIIGAESQGSSKEKIEPVLKKAKVEYTINMGYGGPLQVNGIPRILVFNRAGTLIFDGRPESSEFESTVKKALKEKAPIQEKEAEPIVEKVANLIEQRAWTNSEGKEIQAAVVKANETSVTFLMTNGRSIDYSLEKLSEESRKIIEEAVTNSK